jgi:putative tryptophan/tyrosine transport system substrate-binding protein
MTCPGLGATMRRREFLGAIVGAATTALPLLSRAQQPTNLLIGFLHPGSPEANTSSLAAFRKGLGEAGYTEGRNVAIEFRWAHGDNGRLAELAADLVRRQVAVIVSAIGTATALAAKAATTTIPIFFSAGTDPVEAGIVPSLNRPGGNVTGVNVMASELGAKRLGVLQELVPRAMRIALLVNRTNPVSAESMIKDVERAASAAARHVEVFEASTSREIEMAFAAFMQNRSEALVVGADPFFIERRVQLVTLATRYLLPAIYQLRSFVEVGGLVSYGASDFVRYREVGIYTGRILKGEKPGDMPVVQPTKFELVINLPTARAIGIVVPQSLLAQADEVIE